jgi:hypothetical protein
MSTRYGTPRIEYTVTSFISAAHVLNAFANPLERAHEVRAWLPRREPHHEQADEHGEVTERVQAERPRDAELRDHEGRDRRPDDAREVEAARLERDCLRQILSANELHDQRLSGGDLGGVDDPLKRREHQQPNDGDVARPGKPEQQSRLEQQERLADLHQTESLVAVHEDAGMHRKEHDRQRARGDDESDQEGVVGQLERQPTLPHTLHPCPDERERLAKPKQPEVPVARDYVERVERGHELTK